MNGLECIIGISGVGKVAAANCTRLLIDKGAEHIVNIGSAGVAKEDLDVGDIVISNASIQTDIDLSRFHPKYNRGQAFNSEKIFYEAAPCLVRTATNATTNVKLKASIGKIGTQDQFMNSPQETKKIHDKFGVIAKDMESGAIGQVCDKKGVPFVSLKILSDKPKDETDLQFYDNLEMALDKGSAYLFSFAKQYLLDYTKRKDPTIKVKSNEKVVAIIVATEDERNAVLQKIKRAKIVSKTGENYIEGLINNTRCVLAMAGIGKVNAANCTRGILDSYIVETVVLSGTAGAVTKTLGIGDVVIARKSVQGDFDVTDLNLKKGNCYKKGQLYEEKEQFFNVSPEVDNLTRKIIDGAKIRQGTIITKDRFGSEPCEVNSLIKDFDATCEDTEAAAVAQICQRAKKDCIIIKGISRTSENLDKRSYPINEKMAAKKAAEVVQKFVIVKEREMFNTQKLNMQYSL